MEIADESRYDELIHDKDEYPDIDEPEPQKEEIHDLEWDTLIILDACRWDALSTALKDYNVGRRRSDSNETPKWLNDVWPYDGFEDVTYISGHPATADNNLGVSERAPEMDEYINLVQGSSGRNSAWASRLGTTRPDDLAEIADDHDPPRVVHFMQPHTPYIGNAYLGVHWRVGENGLTESHGGSINSLIKGGYVDIEYVRLAYFSNLLFALESIKQNMDFAEDETVVLTADHGEILWEDNFGHGGMNDPMTRVVPWVEL